MSAEIFIFDEETHLSLGSSSLFPEYMETANGSRFVAIRSSEFISFLRCANKFRNMEKLHVIIDEDCGCLQVGTVPGIFSALTKVIFSTVRYVDEETFHDAKNEITSFVKHFNSNIKTNF